MIAAASDESDYKVKRSGKLFRCWLIPRECPLPILNLGLECKPFGLVLIVKNAKRQ